MRRLILWTVTALLASSRTIEAADPLFENRTPVGFNPADSTIVQDFVSGNDVSIRVDLNQAATPDYPVIGNFHAVERSEQLSATDTDGLQVDIAIVDVAPYFGTRDDFPARGVTQGVSRTAIHTAWIGASSSTAGPVFTGGSTATFEVFYANSSDGGATFSTPVSVSGGRSYYTTDGSGTAFSTLDLEVASNGDPRVVYAFTTTADHSHDDNIYFGYSNNGGTTWETPLKINDVTTAGNKEGRSTAFPRMAIDDRDQIFVSYVRGTSQGGGNDDVMLAKINHHVSPFAQERIGSLGTTGSTGGVRLTPNNSRETGPDLAVGDGDRLQVAFYSETNARIEHKRMATDATWVVVDHQNNAGTVVADFPNRDVSNLALEEDATFYFPTVAIDRGRTPDRIYAVYKWGNRGAPGTFLPPSESIAYNHADDPAVGVTQAATWGTSQTAWSTGNTPLFDNGLRAYNVELDWTITDRVAAVVKDVRGDGGDLHIAFTAGYSGSTTGEHDVFFATFNGKSWTLPEKVADDDSDGNGIEDGIAATDTYLLSPALAAHPDFESLFLAFGGGTGEGFGVNGISNVNHHPYFKVLGRATTSEDKSVPVGAYEYTLNYTPINPQTPVTELVNRPVYVHAADPTDGSGLGANDGGEWITAGEVSLRAKANGFLSGTWERVGTSLQDTQKRFEGLIDESPGDSKEWGDEDDKIGLLVKLNVLGSDSSTNLQLVTNSSAAERSIAVGTAPPVSLVAGAFFTLGADIDIVATNTAPTVSISDPDGSNDTANTSYQIRYDLSDADDDLSSTLNAAFYAYPASGLATVQDILIFGTLIADQNDVSARNASGTDDLTEGTDQTYTWDDPPSALQTSSLFASILKVRSDKYFIYLVADDGGNPPVFAVSPGPITLIHGPVVQQVDPIVADTVDTGQRTGVKANPYDLDFSVVDYDSEARVQLFYSAVRGLTSVSASGTYPNESFVLGKSVSGNRGTAITDSTTLSGTDREFLWDVTSPIITQGAYYLYAVASDGVSVAVGNSGQVLQVAHSPSLTLYEPARNTQRTIDSGSQPVYTFQWQKGQGDRDLDHDASISLYYTEVNPATTNYSGSDATALTSSGGGNAKLIVGGLSENSDGVNDMYVWDFRTSTNVPTTGTRVWAYAVSSDASGNVDVALGGSLLITHSPHILLKTGTPEINQGDIVRIEWDDYMVNDGSGTEDAYIRLYASPIAGRTKLSDLEADLIGAGGNENTYVINSDDGTGTGTITSIREHGSNTFSWDTSTTSFSVPEGPYSIYAAIGADATFVDNARGEVSEGPGRLIVRLPTGTAPHMLLSPNRLHASVGDTLTIDVYVQTDGGSATAVTAALNLESGLSVVNSTTPFTDLNQIFTSGGTVLENTTIGTQVRFSKTGTAQTIGTADTPVALARFQVAVVAGGTEVVEIKVDDTEAAITISGSSVPLRGTTGMSIKGAHIQRVARGRLTATVMLEGRAPPLGNGDHASLLDVHLRIPGSTIDITDALYLAANDDRTASADTVEVQTTSSGALTLVSIPAGRYVLTVKDSSHISGRTDTLTIRNGEMIFLTSAEGLFASDVRGDASFLLGQNGRMLKGGDASGDNEIDEDDVNVIDAAWGTDSGKTRFAFADLNNDGRVGIEDLAAAISNISNSTGLGAPPVYKPLVVPAQVGKPNDQVWIYTPPEQEWLAGNMVDLTFWVSEVENLSAYELVIPFDESQAEPVSSEVKVGDAFQPNPLGVYRRVSRGENRLELVAARRGREWSLTGAAALARVRLRLFQDGFPSTLQGTRVRLLDANYSLRDLELGPGATDVALPKEFVLGVNYPNPFNPITTIPFRIPVFPGMQQVPLRLEIFNGLGQRVRYLVDEPRAPGYFRSTWDGRDDAGRPAGSGVYFYRLRTGEMVATGKMLLLE